MKRMVVPDAMRVTRLRPGRKYCVLNRMAEECGWKYKDLVERLEAGRKTAIAPYGEAKKAEAKARHAAKASTAKPAVLTASGY